MLFSMNIGWTSKSVKMRKGWFSMEPGFIGCAFQMAREGTIEYIDCGLRSLTPEFRRNMLGVNHTTYQLHNGTTFSLDCSILLGSIGGR